MDEPTIDDIDALIGPATPHFAFQLRARLLEAVDGLPEGDLVRLYAQERVAMLERLGNASSRAEDDPQRESPERLGWETLPSSAPAWAVAPVEPR